MAMGNTELRDIAGRSGGGAPATGVRSFSSLSEQEVLALAISNEEEDGRTYTNFAQSLRDKYPDNAACSRTWPRRKASTGAR